MNESVALMSDTQMKTGADFFVEKDAVHVEQMDSQNTNKRKRADLSDDSLVCMCSCGPNFCLKSCFLYHEM